MGVPLSLRQVSATFTRTTQRTRLGTRSGSRPKSRCSATALPRRSRLRLGSTNEDGISTLHTVRQTADTKDNKVTPPCLDEKVLIKLAQSKSREEAEAECRLDQESVKDLVMAMPTTRGIYDEIEDDSAQLDRLITQFIKLDVESGPARKNELESDLTDAPVDRLEGTRFAIQGLCNICHTKAYGGSEKPKECSTCAIPYHGECMTLARKRQPTWEENICATCNTARDKYIRYCCFCQQNECKKTPLDRCGQEGCPINLHYVCARQHAEENKKQGFGNRCGVHQLWEPRKEVEEVVEVCGSQNDQSDVVAGQDPGQVGV